MLEMFKQRLKIWLLEYFDNQLLISSSKKTGRGFKLIQISDIVEISP